jgi:hypothetical protein
MASAETDEIYFWTWYGESLAAGAAPALHTVPPLPDRYFMFNDGYGVKGLHNGRGQRVDGSLSDGFHPDAVTDLVPAFEGADGRSEFLGIAEESPITAAVLFYEHLRANHHLPPRMYIGRGHAESGQAIKTLLPGSRSWLNGLAERTRAAEIAAARGMALRVPAAHFTQGANDRNASKPRRYGVKLEEVAAAYLEELKAQFGPEAGRRFYIDQFSASQNNGAHDVGAGNVALAQREAGRRNPLITCVLPKYFLPYQPGPSQVHVTSASTQLLGEYHALARFMDEHPGIHPGGFQPCDVVNISRHGRELLVRCHLPQGGGLFFSDNFTGRAANMGFSYTDDSGAVSIVDVSITGPAEIRIVLSDDPEEHDARFLSYALNGGPGDREGRAGTWGNVFSASPTESLHQPGRSLHHALLTFLEPV